MQSYTIHLIRHGVTQGNLLGQYIGSTDLPLAQEGIDRLRSMAAGGGYPKAQAYYCSPLQRCRETLALLYPGAEPVIVEDFRECDFGAWEAFPGMDGERIAGDPSRRGIRRCFHAPRLRGV